jgi:hypothetical protein
VYPFQTVPKGTAAQHARKAFLPVNPAAAESVLDVASGEQGEGRFHSREVPSPSIVSQPEHPCGLKSNINFGECNEHAASNMHFLPLPVLRFYRRRIYRP